MDSIKSKISGRCVFLVFTLNAYCISSILELNICHVLKPVYLKAHKEMYYATYHISSGNNLSYNYIFFCYERC